MRKWMRAALAAWVVIFAIGSAQAEEKSVGTSIIFDDTTSDLTAPKAGKVALGSCDKDAPPNALCIRGASDQTPARIARELPASMGPDGPCSGFNPSKHRLFEESFNQMFTPIRDLGAWVDGTHDAELENIGVVTTARGSPEDVLIASNEVGSDGLWLFQAGSVANTGLNMQFTLTDTCLTGTRCHPMRVPVAWLSGWGGNELCAVMRFGVYAFNPVDDGTDETTVTGGTWDSSLVIGFANLDTTIQNATTGALSRGVGTSTWSGDGCLFHLSRAGVLAFRCGVGSSNQFLPATGNTVDVSTLINHQKAHGYPTFFDVGFRISQEPDGPDVNNGSVQGWYRVVPHPGNNNHETVTPTAWTMLGSMQSGDDVLPISDPDAQLHFTLEFIQGSGNTDPDDGLAVFIGGVSAYTMNGIAIHDESSWPHH